MPRGKDRLSWYARKADANRVKAAPGPRDDRGRKRRVAALLSELKAGGIKGDIETRTLFTRGLAPGCRGCLSGRGTNLYVTGLCTRDCFFCFNAKPRKDETVVHGIPISRPDEACAIVERYGLRSVGLSGGEPLLYPKRVLALLKALRSLPRRVRIDLYTNGDRASDALLKDLRAAGLDAIRFNLVANGFDYAPVARALKRFDEVAVEVPVVPGLRREQEDMVRRLDAMGLPFLNLHELFSCVENRERVVGKGYADTDRDSKTLLWRPVAEGEEAALSLLLFALNNTKKLSTYYCSTGTQELIGRRGWSRRARVSSTGPL